MAIESQSEQPTTDEFTEGEEADRVGIKMDKVPRRIRLEGDAKDYTYIVPITEHIERILNLKDRLVLPEGKFLRKAEFHVTPMGFGTRDAIRKRVEEASVAGENLVEKINAILSDIDFSFSLNLDSFKLIHNKDYDPEAVKNKTGQAAFESEDTIIVDVDMPGMAELYNRMREIGIELGKPSSHITLYIKQNGEATGLGIAITDFKEQLEGRKFPNIEYRELSSGDL